jgi:hypothetical protein
MGDEQIVHFSSFNFYCSIDQSASAIIPEITNFKQWLHLLDLMVEV